MTRTSTFAAPNRLACSIALLAAVACTPSYVPDALPTWVDVTTHPCALNELGEVACWHHPDHEPFGSDPDLFRVDTEAVSLQSDTPDILRGLSADGQALVVFCTRPDPAGCEVPDMPLRAVTDWGGLRLDGALVRRPPLAAAEPPERRFQVADGARLVAVDSRNEVHLRLPEAEGWTQVPHGGAAQVTGVVAHLDATSYTACVLDIDGAIDCVGDPSWPGMPLDDPPYQMIAGSRGALCVVDRRDRVLCNDGTTHSFGEVRALAVSAYPSLDASGAYVPASANGVSLCAVTASNAVRCAGSRYPTELVEQMDRELRQ